MWNARYFALRYWNGRYWAKVGADPAPVTGGMVWVWTNGVSVPPANQITGTTERWMWVNGAVVIPTPKLAPWPRRARPDERR